MCVHACGKCAQIVEEEGLGLDELDPTSDHGKRFLSNLHGNTPDRWREDLAGQDRLRFIVNAMTRMRFCSSRGQIEFTHKGPAHDAPAGFMPWFAVPERASHSHTLICGHWSALGFRSEPGLLALDSGCLWGGALTAVRLDDGEVFQLPCVGTKRRA